MKIWIDVTDFEKWSGNLTGIQRVSLSLATGYSKDEFSVEFFHYSHKDRKFYISNFKPQDFENTGDYKEVSPKQNYKELALRIIPSTLVNIMPKKTKVLSKRALIKTKTAVSSIISRFSSLKAKIKGKDGAREQIAEFNKHDIVLIPGNAWDNIYTARDLGALKRDRQFNLVYVIYDLIPVVEPQLFGGLLQNQYHEYLFEALTAADLLLPISESTQRDIDHYCSKYLITPPKTSVIRLGYDLPSAREAKPDWIEANENFIICVGTFEIRKNHISLYYAYREILSRGETPPKLVIVGREGWYVSDLKMLLEQDTHIRNLITVKSNVNDSELSWLYSNCQFSIYPSVYEGWGLPISESLARGTPVLSSKSSSMSEAGGEFVEYFSPYDTGEIADLIIKYSREPQLLKEKRKEITDKFKPNSWQHNYKDVKEAIINNINKEAK